jgi:hypothetical protein
VWVQGGFRKKLMAEVAAFVQDARSFRIEWEAYGPMVAGLDPMEAVERLQKFQQPFEVRVQSGVCSLCQARIVGA